MAEGGVLLITWNFPPRRGGLENLLAGLSNELGKTRALFVITACAPDEDRCEESVSRSSRPGLLPFFLFALRQSFRLLRQHPGIEVIMGGSAMATPLVLIAARRFGKKCVVLVHGLDLVYSHPLYRWLCVRWLAKCDRVIANSRNTARLAEEKKVDRAAISVIHPGVNPAPAPSAGDPKEKLGLAGRKILLYVGRLAKRKGVAEFIRESLPAIAAAIPEACLLVAGENPKGALLHRDDIAGEIQKAAEETGLQSQVRLLGWVADEQLGEMYRAADLLIMPGLRTEDDVEGFGIVLIEAAAAGKPCVATRVGGIPDAVEDGKSGLLVEPGDYDGMSRAIVDLLRDDRKRLALGEYARARAEKDFSWEVIAQKYESVFESLGE